MKGLARGLARVTILGLIAAGLLSANADAAGLAPHRIVGAAGASRFWTPDRIARALRWDGRPGSGRRVPSSLARSSSIGVADASSVEDRMYGRIFAVDPRQGPYSCSGTALTTPSRSIVLTAGHCVVENHSWGTHIAFIPAFDYGQEPFGAFDADAVYVTPQWRRRENNDFDVAALHVAPNEFGALADVVGSRSYEFDRPRFLPLQIFGYPAGVLDGQVLRECDTFGLGSDPLTAFLPGPPTLPGRCDMAAGSSGGAWIADGQYIDGVTSYGYNARHNRLFSPYFGAEIGGFLQKLP